MRTTCAVACLTSLLTVVQPAPRPAALTFLFQNQFWVNLHHVVRGDARRASLKLPVAVATESLQPAARTAWSEASGPIVVDACAEAGPNNAYTTDGPSGTAGHTVVAVRTPSNSGDAGVETIFHEASHTIDDQIARPFVEEAARQHIAFPDGLDHAILFYTTGEIMRREFARTGKSGYVPYGDRFDVYRNGWQQFRVALEKDWLPYLDGRTSFEAAVTAVVRDARVTRPAVPPRAAAF